MVRIFRLLVVMTLLLMAFATPATGADQVPIKGPVMGTHERVMFDEACHPENAPPDAVYWSFSSEGEGQLSHLGRVDYYLTQCTVPVDELFVSVGTVLFIAANGDELRIIHTMSGHLAFGDAGPVGFVMEGEWTPDGGTGRFANAMGAGGTLAGAGDIPDGERFLGLPDGLMELNFTGQIAYDASDSSNN